ncbi:MAG: PP2C family serine/threonine-protein phosphatase [Armatimonadetes bacterium]|nr:PP2C family serine/threonine-protein phosphatase [Armatimonadota bacterium]
MGPATDPSAVKWQIAAASVQGTGHARLGLPCQDAHGSVLLPDGALALAVADGAGSAARSEVGSAEAVRVALATVAAAWPECAPIDSHLGVIRAAFVAARAALEDVADRDQCALGDLATTLIVLCLTERGAVAGQVGDGAAVVQHADGRIEAMTRPQTGEYLNTTVFITSQGWEDDLQLRGLADEVTGGAAFSDGLEMLALAMPAGEPHAPFFGPILRFAQATPDADEARQGIEAFLTSPRVTDRADDDLTLVAAALASPA